MTNEVQEIIEATEKDLSTLGKETLNIKNKELLINAIKKSASEEIEKVFNNIIKEHKGSSDLYDFLKEKCFNIVIERKIITDAHINNGKKKRYDHKKLRKDIVKALVNIKAIWNDDLDRPKNMLSSEKLAKMFDVNITQMGTILWKMGKDKILGNIPHQGWYLLNEPIDIEEAGELLNKSFSQPHGY
jgi:hypothetical protein